MEEQRFNIEEYLNHLPDDIKKIDLSNKSLKYDTISYIKNNRKRTNNDRSNIYKHF